MGREGEGGGREKDVPEQSSFVVRACTKAVGVVFILFSSSSSASSPLFLPPLPCILPSLSLPLRSRVLPSLSLFSPSPLFPRVSFSSSFDQPLLSHASCEARKKMTPLFFFWGGDGLKPLVAEGPPGYFLSGHSKALNRKQQTTTKKRQTNKQTKSSLSGRRKNEAGAHARRVSHRPSRLLLDWW